MMVAVLKEGLHVWCASDCSSGEAGRPRVGILESPVKVSLTIALCALQLHFLESLRVSIAEHAACRSRLAVTIPHPLYILLMR